jgi:hypothetical protein
MLDDYEDKLGHVWTVIDFVVLNFLILNEKNVAKLT